jgi:hypothetical protein
MAVISNANTILPGDRLRDVVVTVRLTVNWDAWAREYVWPGMTLRDIREAVRADVLGAIEDGSVWPDGLVSDAELVS